MTIIEKEAKRIAFEIYKGMSRYDNLTSLQEKIEKELIPYKIEGIKIDFLNRLQEEVSDKFRSHLSTCTKVNDCPQHKTFQNFSFLIKQEKNQLVHEMPLSSLMKGNLDFDYQIKLFHDKLKTTSAFLKKEEFINAEIKRIQEVFIKPIKITFVGGGKVSSEMNYHEYKRHAYEWLMQGFDWPISQILKNAKQTYLSNGGVMYDEKEFNTAVIDNLRAGVALIQYQKFLTDQLNEKEKKSNQSNKKKRTTVSYKVKALLQKEIKSCCPFCKSEDVDHFEIHHIDESPDNNSFDNLLMLCPLCHSKITKGDIKFDAVVAKKGSFKNGSGYQ